MWGEEEEKAIQNQSMGVKSQGDGKYLPENGRKKNGGRTQNFISSIGALISVISLSSQASILIQIIHASS